MMEDTKYKEIKIDRFQYGLLLHLLNEERNLRIKEGKPTDDLDIIIIKLIDSKERKSLFAKKEEYEVR